MGPSSLFRVPLGVKRRTLRAMAAIPYREQLLRVREDAIVQAVNRLLATKGYDLMTVDEVAAEAGMAKASLYKHLSLIHI